MNLETDPDRAAQLCREAHARLAARLEGLPQDIGSAPSLLPGWTVGHVLTHLARNADAHARRLQGALDGRDVSKYAGGERQRQVEIDQGAQQPIDVILVDLLDSQARLETLLSESVDRRWPHRDFLGAGHYPVAGCPAHRLREVEMHHVDLGLGYTAQEWPDEYVAWDLPVLLATVPERLRGPRARRSLMAWLAGRGRLDPTTPLEPW